MNLKEKMEKDFQIALKTKAGSLSILRMLKAAVQNAEIAKGINYSLNDQEMEEAIRRQVKQLEDALVDFQKGGRADLAKQAEREIAVLRAYLPAGLTDVEIVALVEEVVKESGTVSPADFGRVMGAVMKKAGGKAEGNKVKEMVEKALTVK